ncbi:MAG: LptF/LptG family permease [Candidatus Omnitrophica bacterium]|nr:LptF/LptG family permease [Candidatus Omnitrophota bacterium]
MRILRAYILREHASPFFVTMGGLTAVLLVGNIIKFAELVVAKGVSPFDVLRLMIYLSPYMLSFTVPMACLISMILAFGRLSADYELIAMRAAGVAPIRLVFPMVLVGLVVSTLLLIVNDRVVPASHLAFRRQLKAIGVKQPTAYLEAGTFIKDFPPYIIFVYHVDGQKLDNVRIYEPQPNGPTRTIIADRGEFERLPSKRGVQLRLYDGTVDEWDPLRPGTFYKVTFTTYAMTLRSDQQDPERIGKKLRELTFKELMAQRQRLSAEGIETLPVSLELHRKIASSYAVLVFVLFGLAFGLRLHHHERLTSFLWVLTVFVSYYLGMIGTNALALKGWLSPAMAMWLPNLVGGAVSSVMVLRAVRR